MEDHGKIHFKINFFSLNAGKKPFNAQKTNNIILITKNK